MRSSDWSSDVCSSDLLDADVRAQGLARTAEQARLKAMYPGDPGAADAALKTWDAANPVPTTSVAKVADHIDHLKKTIGVDHIGLGGEDRKSTRLNSSH